MSDPDKKTYRIWLNPEASAKIENVRTQDFEELKIEFWNDETKREEYLPEEESKAIETQGRLIFLLVRATGRRYFRLSDKDFTSKIEVDFRVTENSSIPSLRNILVLFNGVPGVCIFDKFMPEECPDERIFHLVGSGQNISESQFQNLSTWPNLTSLDLTGCRSLTNVDGLSGLTNLTRLKLSSCESLTNVDGLSGLTNLKTLEFKFCSKLTNVDCLSGLTNLTCLDIGDCESLTNVDCLSGLTNLKSLYLWSFESLTNVDCLSGLPNLKTLEFKFCSKLTNVDCLGGLTNLTSLKLSSCESLTNVDGLSGLTNLTSLKLTRCRSLTNVDGLSGLTNLTSLDLWSCESLTNVDGLSGLTNLTCLDIGDCESLTNVDGLSGLTNLKSLYLWSCESLTNVDGLSGLTNLTSLNLKGCNSLTNVDGLSGLTNLTDLDLGDCESLTNVDGLSGLTNLTSLDLKRCNSLTNVDGLSGLTKLTSLDLSQCESLTNIDGLRGLTKLTSLNLSQCKSLTNVDCLSGLTNLTSLNLGHCSSLTNMDALSGLTNLTSLKLGHCSSLTNMDALSGLTKLRSLDLGTIQPFFLKDPKPLDLMPLDGLINLRKLNLEFNATINSLNVLTRFGNLSDLRLMHCEPITNLNFLNGITNLETLLLSGCKSLENTDGLVESKNIRLLMLNDCQSLTNISGLRELKKLEVLTLENSPFVGNIDFLRDLPRLRKFTFFDPFKPVSILSTTGRNDVEFVKNKAKDWLNVTKKAPEPDELLCDLSDTFGLYAKESWANDALSQLVNLMLSRNESAENTWGSLLGAVAKCQIVEAQVILEFVTDEMNQERASSVLRPLLKTLASLPESLGEWANEQADELLDSLSIEFLRDYGPSVCLFYARMEREDRLRSWLEKLTDPETPLWRDRIHLALGQWEIGRGDLNSPRARLKEMCAGASKDELLETLARAMAKKKPLEAGELLDQISEEWRQVSLSAELAEEPAFTEPAENAYRLLLRMERDPDKLADWVATLTRNHPQSELAKEVARTFGPGDQGAHALSALLSDLLEKEVIVKATKENQLKSFKEELMAEGEAESFLLETLVGRMCKRGLVNEEEAKELLENLRGEKE